MKVETVTINNYTNINNLKQVNAKKTMTYGIGNPGHGLQQTQNLFCSEDMSACGLLVSVN